MPAGKRQWPYSPKTEDHAYVVFIESQYRPWIIEVGIIPKINPTLIRSFANSVGIICVEFQWRVGVIVFTIHV